MARERRLVTALCILFLLLPLAACQSEARDDADEAPATESAQTAETTPPPPVAPPKPVWLSASHVLIQYAGSERAAAEITRTKEEALELAQQIAERARGGEDFATLAKEYSDGPSAPRGGALGQFPAGQMVPAFSQACMQLEVGQTSDPVETQFGYHVILRDREVELVGARHILIMHTGSARVPPTVTRTKEEALTRAQEALQKVRDGADFAEIAREYSDGPSAPNGGNLGSFPRGAMVPAFDTAVFALEVGGVSEIVETQFGYHVIQRYE